MINKAIPGFAIALFLFSSISIATAETPDQAKEKRTFFRYGEVAEYENHNWEDALMFYQKALEGDPQNEFSPKNGQCQAKMAFGNYQLKKNDQTIAAYRELLSDKYPDYRDTYSLGWFNLGLVQLLSGNENDAREAFQRALKIDSKNADAHFGLGKIYEKKYSQTKVSGDKNKAIEEYRAFTNLTDLKHGSRAQEAERRLIALEYGKAGELYAQALEAYESAFTEADDFNQIVVSVRRAYGLAEESLKLKPAFQYPHYLKGLIHFSIKLPEYYNPGKAVEEWGKAPSVKEARIELGRERLGAGDFPRAIAFFQSALALGANYPPGHYFLGLAYKNTGEKKQAVSEWLESIRSDPAGIYASKAREEINKTNPSYSLVAKADLEILAGGSGTQGLVDVPSPEKYSREINLIEKRYGERIEGPDSLILNQMAGKIVGEADLPNKGSYQMILLDSNNENAFSSPDGRIYITQGLLKFIKARQPEKPLRENDILAFVLAHELVHALKQHVPQADLVRMAIDREGESMPQNLAPMLRAQEFEADRLATLYIFQAGYNPNASLAFLTAFALANHEITPGLDHPTFDERISRLEDYWNNEIRPVFNSFRWGVMSLEEAIRMEEAQNAKAGEFYLKAIDEFMGFLKVFGASKQALNNLGVAFLKMAQIGSEPPEWRTASSIDPKLMREFISLRKEQTRAGRGDKLNAYYLKRAEESLALVFKIDPEYGNGLANLGMVYFCREDFENALIFWQKAVKVNQSRGDFRNNLGVALCSTGQLEGGIQEFQEALKLNPQDPSAAFNLALAYERINNPGKAVEAYDAFLRIEKNKNGWRERAEKSLAKLQTEPTKQ
jgi:tetratricopeptide (TPR) repeat protein